MKVTRCKMICNRYKVEGDIAEVHMSPVIGDENNKENSSFFKYTPGGELYLSVVNPNVKFEEGKEYYIDIILAE